MNTTRNGYAAPWSNRREIAGLMGTFMIALISSSGHSDLLGKQVRHLVQQLIRLVLVFFGLVTPMGQAPTIPFHHTLGRLHHKIPVIAHAPAPAPSRVAPPSVSVEMHGLPMNTFQKHWTYIFEGKATIHDQPCRNANIQVRLSNGDDSVTQGTLTGADGSYVLRVGIDARDGDPVDWTLDAYTTDLQKVELTGRNIVQPSDPLEVQKEQQPIRLNTPVDFVLTLNH
jgi:hypothetical protein